MPMQRVKTSQQPMVVVAFFVVLGLYLGWVFDLNLWITLMAAVVALSLHFILRHSIFLPIMLLSIGLSVTTVWRDGGEDLEERTESYSLQILGRNRAYVDGYRADGGGWRGVHQRLHYSADSTLVLESGDRVVVYGRVRSGFIYLTGRNTTKISESRPFSYSVNRWASGRLERLGLSRDALSLVESMLLGRREQMGRELRESYNRSGAGHLLAVSGLHLAIIFTIFALMFRVLHLLPYGHVARHMLVLVALWGYCAVVGMGASVVRATMMVSVFQIAHMLHRSYSSLNALTFTAMAMVILDPSTLFEYGFLLSVIAVFSIVSLAAPITNRYRIVAQGGFVGRILNALSSAFIVGAICSVAVIPLISYIFGYISPWGVLINPLVVTTTFLLLLISLIWVLFGVAFLAPLFRIVIDGLAQLQNYIVESAAVSYDLRLELWEVLIIYALYLFIAITLRRFLLNDNNLRAGYCNFK